MGLSVNIYTVLCLSIVLAFSACDGAGDDKKIGTEMVDIPSSLHEGERSKNAEITFEELEVSTGKISQGEIFKHTFNFTNTGNAPLVMSSVEGSCGCTVARNYPKGKIMPGEGGSIDVEFDSDNKWGDLTVTISVVTNTMPAATQLIIRADVVVPDNMKIK